MPKKTKRQIAWDKLLETLNRYPMHVREAALEVCYYGMTVEQLMQFEQLMSLIHTEKCVG